MTPEELSDILPPHIYMIKENLMNLLCEMDLPGSKVEFLKLIAL